MNPRELRRLAVLADRLDVGRLGEERAHDRPVALPMEAEVTERIGVAAFDDGIGFGRQFGHQVSLAGTDKIRSRAPKGTRSNSPRWFSPSSISEMIFSSK